MKMFQTQPDAHPSKKHEKIYSRYEKLYTLNDFIAAVAFLIGSVMFFDKNLETLATWFFTIGSMSFMLRPTIKLIREYHLTQIPLPNSHSSSAQSV